MGKIGYKFRIFIAYIQELYLALLTRDLLVTWVGVYNRARKRVMERVA